MHNESQRDNITDRTITLPIVVGMYETISRTYSAEHSSSFEKEHSKDLLKLQVRGTPRRNTEYVLPQYGIQDDYGIFKQKG